MGVVEDALEGADGADGGGGGGGGACCGRGRARDVGWVVEGGGEGGWRGRAGVEGGRTLREGGEAEGEGHCDCWLVRGVLCVVVGVGVGIVDCGSGVVS